ncbi:hypothetical protein SDC9_51881 [bioreactor metagenome]|uniref:Uncharacterized protein n=1 Tax=bioreactor metagenome TaxID=1076179 RepID=A0A644WQ02_9ZZZZ
MRLVVTGVNDSISRVIAVSQFSIGLRYCYIKGEHDESKNWDMC